MISDEDDRVSPFRRWSPAGRRAVAVALAFVLGLTAGGYGWHQWQSHRADQARDRVVNLFARVTQYATAPNARSATPPSMAIQVTNAGPRPVRIDAATLPGPGVITSIRPVSRGVTVPANGTAFIALNLEVDCGAAGQFTQPQTVTLKVHTSDGHDATHAVRLADDTLSVLATVQDSCRGDAPSLSGFISAAGSPGRATAAGQELLTFPVEIQADDVDVTSVVTVFTLTNALNVTASPMPARTNGGRAGMSLTWRVVNCVAAQQLDPRQLNLVLTVTLPGDRTYTVPAEVDTSIAIEVVRLVDRSCSNR